MADKPSYQKRISYQAVLLGGFATLATIMLLLGDITTREAIAERVADDMRESLSQVIRPELHDNNLLDSPLSLENQGQTVTVYRGTRDGQVTAMAYQVSDYGYGGEIKLIIGMDPAGTILGVRVLSHAETPGLGDKMEIARSNWITHFNGLSLDNTPEPDWAVKKDGGRFDQFTGATITPRAIVRAIRSGLEFFHDHEDELTAAIPRQPQLAGAPDHE